MAAWAPVVGGTIFISDWNDRHLYIILNDPIFSRERGGDVCLLANVSTCGGRFDDLTCVFAGNCHSYIRNPSYLVYARARVERASNLQELVAKGLFVPYPDPLDLTLVKQALLGFDTSPHSNGDTRELAMQILNR